MTTLDHLSEQERQGIADGSLSPEEHAMAASHIETCDLCRADVARLEHVVKSARDLSPAVTGDDALDDVWRRVRAGIEERKIIPLPAPDGAAAGSRPRTDRRRWIAGAAAAVVLVAATTVMLRARPKTEDVVALASGPSLTTVAESTHVFEQEVQTLLNELELRRAFLRPETAASIDKSLHIIDQAIAELRDALARDPNNPSLRQLLASSYRQKVDLLKRVGNAG